MILQKLRAGTVGIVHLLLLALALQWVSPVLSSNPAAGSAGAGWQQEQRLLADVHLSLCQISDADANGRDDSSSPVPASPSGKHCPFCLPTGPLFVASLDSLSLGDVAVHGVALLPLPQRQVQDSTRPTVLRSRAPPVLS